MAVQMWTELCRVYPVGIVMEKDRAQFSKAIGQSLEGTLFRWLSSPTCKRCHEKGQADLHVLCLIVIFITL